MVGGRLHRIGWQTVVALALGVCLAQACRSSGGGGALAGSGGQASACDAATPCGAGFRCEAGVCVSEDPSAGAPAGVGGAGGVGGVGATGGGTGAVGGVGAMGGAVGGAGAAGACMPDCAGRQCGPDPVCATSCGSCGDGLSCDPDGRCEDPCALPPFTQDSVLDLDVGVVTVAGTLTMNGATLPDDTALDGAARALLRFTDTTTGAETSVGLGETGPGAYSIDLYASTYDVTLVSNVSGSQTVLPRLGRVRLGPCGL